jgi:hypothetical protein
MEEHPMSAVNRAVSRRFHEAIGKGSAQAVQAELAPNYVAHFPGIPGPLDAEGFTQLVKVFGSAFPDSHFDVVENSVELDQLGLLQQLGVIPPPSGQGS